MCSSFVFNSDDSDTTATPLTSPVRRVGAGGGGEAFSGAGHFKGRVIPAMPTPDVTPERTKSSASVDNSDSSNGSDNESSSDDGTDTSSSSSDSSKEDEHHLDEQEEAVQEHLLNMLYHRDLLLAANIVREVHMYRVIDALDVWTPCLADLLHEIGLCILLSLYLSLSFFLRLSLYQWVRLY